MLFEKELRRAKKMQFGIVCAIAAMAASFGCATSGSTDGAATAADAQAAKVNGAVVVESKADEVAAIGVKRECRSDIVEFVRNVDGTIGVLTADKSLFQIGTDGSPAKLRDLPDEARHYTLMPFSNIVIHRTHDSVMVEDVATGLELFKLQGDASIDHVWYSLDFEQLAIQTADARYNVWNTRERFAGVSTGETVQDFMNRQSPDHSLRYPGVVRAMALGKDGNIAVAADDPDSGKVGLIYHLDTVNAPGKLAVQARTNTPITAVAISPSSNYISVIDENGDFYFVNTVDKKGFIAFAKLYQKVHDIAFWGNYPVVLQDNRLAIVDYKNGSVWSEVAERFDKCAVSGDSIYCSGDGYFSVISAQTGKISKRYAFKDGVFAVVDVEKAEVSGDLADRCM